MTTASLDARRSRGPSSLGRRRPSLLMVATIPATLKAFLLPLAAHFRKLGWRVDGMARDVTGSPECVAAFDRCRDVPWSRNPLDPRNLFGALKAARRAVEEGAYDIVHVHTPVAGFVTRLALRNRLPGSGPRVIYTAHGFHFYQGGSVVRNAIFRALERLAGRWTDALVVMNREDEEAARALEIVPAARVRFMPGIGVETSRYRPGAVRPGEVLRIREELGLPPAAEPFLMVAELTAQKHHADVLQALARLSTRNAFLLIAGSGPLENDLRRMARSLGIGDRVRFLGYREDIPVLLRASRALLLASELEGLPRSVMEAMCMETPVIGVRIRGIEDLLEDECGLLVEPGDPTGLARAMGQVLDEPEGVRALALRARARVDPYDLGNILSLHEALYRDVMSSS